MPYQGDTLKDLTYRLILILPGSRKILVSADGESASLPFIRIPQGVRVAQEVQKAIRDLWDLDVIILESLPIEDADPPCVIAEVLCSKRLVGLSAVGIDQLMKMGLGETLLGKLASAFRGNTLSNGPFSRVGWIDQAVVWLESETGKRLSSKSQIEQYNAGAEFALLRLTVDEGIVYWLKAVATPGESELPLTQALGKLCPDALPALLSVNYGWGAWLTMDAGNPIPEGADFPTMERAVATMAKLQRRSVESKDLLLNIGALDRSPRMLHNHCSQLFAYLEEATAQQRSSNAPRLAVSRLQDMERLAEEACLRLDDLRIPDAIVHGDMNRGNVVHDGFRCRFLDWRETYIGNPFVALEHLLLLGSAGLTRLQTTGLKEAYVKAWLDLIPASRIGVALKLMPAVAGLSALLGRGDWLESEYRNSAARQRYARNIARQMDRSFRSPELSGLLSSRSLTGYDAASQGLPLTIENLRGHQGALTASPCEPDGSDRGEL